MRVLTFCRFRPDAHQDPKLLIVRRAHAETYARSPVNTAKKPKRAVTLVKLKCLEVENETDRY